MMRTLPSYLEWHYCYGGEDVRKFLKNILWFLWNFFSVGLLAKTLFSPWQKLDERRSRGGIQAFFETLIINILMRLVGALIRTLFIIVGFSIFILAAALSLCLMVAWYVLPLVVLGIFVAGAALIFYRP